MTHPAITHKKCYLFLKRCFDLTLCFIGISACFPLLLIVSLAIKIDSPGPVFYRGVRSGLFGAPFRIFKFRTMVEHAESLGGPTTGTNDNRVTRIGALLRRTKLDELPQLLNVLVGDMSLVGPRPEVLGYTAKYKGEEKYILCMRPGITDYASIEFADLDELVGHIDPDRYFREHILPHKNALRVKYVKEWSLASDFKILWATFNRILSRVVNR